MILHEKDNPKFRMIIDDDMIVQSMVVHEKVNVDALGYAINKTINDVVDKAVASFEKDWPNFFFMPKNSGDYVFTARLLEGGGYETTYVKRGELVTTNVSSTLMLSSIINGSWKMIDHKII
jgi:hypothetical protein